MSLRTIDQPQLDFPLAKTWPAVLLLGITTLVLGVLAVAWPAATVLSLAIIFGLQLVVFGAYRAVAAFSSEGEGHRIWYLLVGIIAIAVGVVCLRNLLGTVAVLGFALGLGWVVIGILDVLGGLFYRTSRDRGLRVATGALSMVAGIIVLSSPGLSLVALAWVLGIWLVVLGALEIAFAISLRRRLHVTQGAAEVSPRPAPASPPAS